MCNVISDLSIISVPSLWELGYEINKNRVFSTVDVSTYIRSCSGQVGPFRNGFVSCYTIDVPDVLHKTHYYAVLCRKSRNPSCRMYNVIGDPSIISVCFLWGLYHEIRKSRILSTADVSTSIRSSSGQVGRFLNVFVSC